ncbi:hypothetical protein BJ322DRAFT_242082 [Thelephora terrestris]|uniref:Uncharacterized protein n=1 Tax=Thelephora terrestris TaxID=56493 RepID=A0A9P6L439_9AGAM|nr:hypothetical protein BJ322DRAFT_242082 [Thelephora terrestris]
MNVVPNGKSFELVPSGRLGITEDQLPSQPIRGTISTSLREDVSKLNGTVVSSGTAVNGKGWGQTLQRVGEQVHCSCVLQLVGDRRVDPERSPEDVESGTQLDGEFKQHR